MSAAWALVGGAPGFFTLRQPGPWLQPAGCLEATSFYETKLLKATLEQLVDFDRINSGEMRFSVGAMNVRTGNLVRFDSATRTIRPEHVMASGSLPPAFRPSRSRVNTTGTAASSQTPRCNGCSSTASARTRSRSKSTSGARVAEFPGDLAEVATRQKEIQYSSRTRANTDQFKRLQRMRYMLATLLGEAARRFESERGGEDDEVYNIVHLIYRSRYRRDRITCT